LQQNSGGIIGYTACVDNDRLYRNI